MVLNVFELMFMTEEEVIKETEIPTRPDKPIVPDVYKGYYWQKTPSSPPRKVKDLRPYLDLGGWGTFTSGMLTVDGGGKSYGVFG